MPKSYKIEVLTTGDPKWVGNELRFATWAKAHEYGLNLGNRWTMVEEMRTMESDDPVNCYNWPEPEATS